jgi:hypothetical protein
MASPSISASLLLLLLLPLSLLQTAHGSVHVYRNQPFKENGNAFLFYGGSEGIRASISQQAGGAGVGNGRAYIGSASRAPSFLSLLPSSAFFFFTICGDCI